MRRILFLVISLMFLLVSLVLAEEDFANPPQWEVGEIWRYRSREERGRDVWVTTGDFWVTGKLKSEYYVRDLRILRLHPAILLNTTPEEIYGDIEKRDERGRVVIVVFDKELTPIAWGIPDATPFVSIEGWRLFDWPLSLGKKWQGKSKIIIFGKLFEDNYKTEVTTFGTVAVPAGNFRAMAIVQEGRLSGERKKDVSYKLLAWYAPAVRNFAHVTVELQGKGIRFTMELLGLRKL